MLGVPAEENCSKYSTDLSMVLTLSEEKSSSAAAEQSGTKESSSGANTSPEPITNFKIILVGEEITGKSSIGLRLSGRFYEFQHRTLGPNYFSQTVCMDDSIAKFAVWETAFAEQCRSLQPHAAIIVYDITDKKSYDRVPLWIRSLQRNIGSNLVIALAGNKVDLEDSRQVSREEAQKLADGQDLVFLEISAMTGTKVDQLFLETAKRVRAVHDGTYQQEKCHSVPTFIEKKPKKNRIRKSSCTVS